VRVDLLPLPFGKQHESNGELDAIPGMTALPPFGSGFQGFSWLR